MTSTDTPVGQAELAGQVDPSEPEPRFPRPRILVVDVPGVASALQQRGHAATSGTFGQPVLVPKRDGYVSLNLNADLLDYTEQEIVVADLVGPTPQKATDESFEQPAPGVSAVWAPTASGIVDPRPATMQRVCGAMDRIHQHGGIFILFVGARIEPGCFISEKDRYGKLIQPYGEWEMPGVSNWSLLSRLASLRIRNDIGKEIHAADTSEAKEFGLGGFFSGGRFTCVVEPSPWDSALKWITLATNKYGDPVAGILSPARETDRTGLILILPILERRSELVTELLERVLPTLTPDMFPYTDKGFWARQPEYELPHVVAVAEEITKVKETARIRVLELEEQIETERERYGFLHQLITATADELVQAVIQALRTLGFTDVHDVDTEADAAGETGPRREDLRIMDAAVPVLVEVKGIAGTPKEASSLQVAKYIAPRIREWKRYDIRGLAIVNHQRHLPPLDREHEHVFQDDVVTNAEEHNLSLLTAWDLFRLTRGFIMHGWHHNDVAELFVTSGRVHPIPTHYELIGTIDGYWPQVSVLGLRLAGALAVGDRIAYELPIDFIEETITSLRLNDQTVEQSKAGEHVGVKTTLNKQQARKGVRVYRIRPQL